MPRADFPFAHSFRVRYSEVDRQNVAYQAHYLTWFDVALWELVRALPYDLHDHLETTGADFHTVRNVVDYLAPVQFDQQIDVLCRVARIGRSSLTFALEVHPQGQDNALARGEVVWVNATQSGERRAVAIPDTLIALLNGLQAPEPVSG